MRVNVITPWYPDHANPYSGIFVKKQVDALSALGHELTVEVPVIYPAPRGPLPRNVLSSIAQLGASSVGGMYLEEAEATWIPTPVPTASGYQGRADSFTLSLSMKRAVRPVEPDVTHAHLGVPTGWASLQLGDNPLVVTEHQSTLAALLSQRSARDSYRRVLESASAFVCVSHILKRQLVDVFGSWADDRVVVIPNIVDLAHIPFRTRDPSPAFRSWIYVGSLTEHKGVVRLIETFLAYRELVDHEARLTILGSGPLANWVADQAPGAVDLTGPVSHDVVGHYLDRADLMIHLSPRETFGLASLEALGAGLPVVSARNGGSEEAWGEIVSEAGILVDADETPAAIAMAIGAMRHHPGRLNPQTGRSLVESRYSAEAVASKLEVLYEMTTQ